MSDYFDFCKYVSRVLKENTMSENGTLPPFTYSNLAHYENCYVHWRSSRDPAELYQIICKDFSLRNHVYISKGYNYPSTSVPFSDVEYFCQKNEVSTKCRFVKIANRNSWDAGAIYEIVPDPFCNSEIISLRNRPLYAGDGISESVYESRDDVQFLDGDYSEEFLKSQSVYKIASDIFEFGDVVYYDRPSRYDCDTNTECNPGFTYSDSYNANKVFIVLKVSNCDNSIGIANLTNGGEWNVNADKVIKLGSVMKQPARSQWKRVNPVNGSLMRDSNLLPVYIQKKHDDGSRTIVQVFKIPRHVFLTSDVFEQCACCGKIFITSSFIQDMRSIHDTNGNFVCNDCFNTRHYRICDHCGNAFQIGENETVDDYTLPSGDVCCDDCLDRELGYINNYRYKPDPIFHRTEGEDSDTTMFMGVELEVDNGNSVSKCARELNAANTCNHYYLKHDGSLNDGIEIVTHPCTLDYHLQKFPWDNIVEIARRNGFRSHDTKTCGLHVHVSRKAFGDSSDERDLNIAKVLLFFDRYWDRLVKFSRRKYDQLDRWAKKPDAEFTNNDGIIETLEKYDSYVSRDDRYMAVNLTNYYTVEFRLFRGTLNVNTIKATLEFLSNLINCVKEKSLLQMQSIAWEDVINYQDYNELDTYLASSRMIEASNTDDESEEEEECA